MQVPIADTEPRGHRQENVEEGCIDGFKYKFIARAVGVETEEQE